MPTIHIQFKDTKTGVDVRIKEAAALKKLLKSGKPASPAQEHAVRIFAALNKANDIIKQIESEE